LFSLFTTGRPLLILEDLPWLIERARTDTGNAATWIELLGQAITLWQEILGPYFELAVEAASSLPVLQKRLGWYLGPVDLDSDLAREMKRGHRDRVKRQVEEEGRAVAISQTSRVILDAAVAGNVNAFIRLPEALLTDDSDFDP
jgi:hypothetical protein